MCVFRVMSSFASCFFILKFVPSGLGGNMIDRFAQFSRDFCHRQ